MAVATVATGLVRQMAIKPFSPRSRRRELALRDRLPSIHAVRNHIFVEKGTGDTPTIVVGGFVPDATEAVEFQREVFRRHGSIYFVNFSRSGFSAEMFFAQLADLIEDLNRRGKRPVEALLSGPLRGGGRQPSPLDPPSLHPQEDHGRPGHHLERRRLRAGPGTAGGPHG
jgi:hypothetical protein